MRVTFQGVQEIRAAKGCFADSHLPVRDVIAVRYSKMGEGRRGRAPVSLSRILLFAATCSQGSDAESPGPTQGCVADTGQSYHFYLLRSGKISGLWLAFC